MLELLWLVPALPFAGFAALALFGRRLPRDAIAAVGAGSVGLSTAAAGLVAFRFIAWPPPGEAWTQVLWSWIRTDGFASQVALYLDALSVVMMLVVTVVSFLILLYSVQYMAGEEGYSRYFCYMDLFVGSMLTLVLAGNLLLLYLGWEGVGLCSYLLIGFWYTDPANGRAARKAFLVTRVGDTAMLAGFLLLFTSLGTSQIQEILSLASSRWPPGSATAVAAAALLLGGALGKSAQLPLQVWLPDAMAGPTPVSALIHAATMVTAGVYLIARTHVLFALAPAVQTAVAVIGAATLLYAGLAALAQSDIKRVLAYSTISQVGYMFLALGVGAWSAAIFHFVTHAFFKSLLFLAAGVVILRLGHERNMLKMGGLRRALPGAFAAFLIGSASLSALPIVTAGFYSKDLILYEAWSSPAGGRWLWTAGLVGAFLTSVYAFRMVFLTFFGEMRQRPVERHGSCMAVSLAVLSVLSVAAGLIQLPETLGNAPVLTHFLRTALPPSGAAPAPAAMQAMLQIVAGAVSLAGIWAAYLLFLRRPEHAQDWLRTRASLAVYRLWQAGWGFDWLYDRAFVRPFLRLARANRADFIDGFAEAVARANIALHGALSQTQTGRVRWYAMGIAVGAVVVIALVVFT